MFTTVASWNQDDCCNSTHYVPQIKQKYGKVTTATSLPFYWEILNIPTNSQQTYDYISLAKVVTELVLLKWLFPNEYVISPNIICDLFSVTGFCLRWSL